MNVKKTELMGFGAAEGVVREQDAKWERAFYKRKEGNGQKNRLVSG